MCNMYYICLVHRIPYRTMLYNWRDYIRKISEEYIFEMEEYGLCNFHLDDYTQNISYAYFMYIECTFKYFKNINFFF